MAIFYRIYSDTADASGFAESTSYATARSSTVATTASATATSVGQSFLSPNYGIVQYFSLFDTSVVPDGSGTALFSVDITTGAASAGDTWELREASALTNKIASGSLGGLTPLHGSLAIPTATGRAEITITDVATLSRTSTLTLLLHSQNERLNSAPSANNRATIQTADATGTTNDPYLDISLTAEEELVTATGGGSWTVPSGVTVVQIEAWGGGGTGIPNTGQEAGGRGGDYARSILSVTPGDIIYYDVPEGITSGGTPSSTWARKNTNSGPDSADVVALSGGTGGAVSAGTLTGDVTFSGGNGSPSQGGGGQRGGSGGGGAAGPNGAGTAGTAGSGGTGGAGGASNGDTTAGAAGAGGDGTDHVDGGSGAAGGNSGGNNGGIGGAPGGGGGGGSSSGGNAGQGGRGQIRISWIAAAGGPQTYNESVSIGSAGLGVAPTSVGTFPRALAIGAVNTATTASAAQVMAAAAAFGIDLTAANTGGKLAVESLTFATTVDQAHGSVLAAQAAFSLGGTFADAYAAASTLAGNFSLGVVPGHEVSGVLTLAQAIDLGVDIAVLLEQAGASYSESMDLGVTVASLATVQNVVATALALGVDVDLDATSLRALAASIDLGIVPGYEAAGRITLEQAISLGLDLDTALANGSVFAESLALDLNLDVASARTVTLAAAMSLAAQAAVANTSAHTMMGAVDIAGFLSSTAAAQWSTGAEIDLGAVAGILASNGSVFQETIALASDMGLSATAQKDVLGALALGISATATASGTLTLAQTIEIAARAGYTSDGAVTIETAAAFALSLSLASAGALEGRTYNEALALGLAILVEKAAQHDARASLNMGVAFAETAMSQASHALAITLATEVGQAVSSALEISQAMSLDMQPGISLDGRRVITGSLAFPSQFDSAFISSAVLVGGLEFTATFDEVSTSVLTAEESIGLALDALISSGLITATPPASILRVDGVVTQTIALDGAVKIRAGITGSVVLEIRMNGRLN